MPFKPYYFQIFLFIFILNSCHNESNEPKVKLIDVAIQRFDIDLLAFNSKEFDISQNKMKLKYGEIYDFYIQTLLGIGSTNPNHPQYYKPYFTDFLKSEYPAMMDSCKKHVFSKLPEIQNDINNAYSHLLYYFPKKKVPTLYSFFISPLAANPSPAFTYGSDTVGINWFSYLGKDFSLYPGVYEGMSYMIEWHQPKYIARNLMLVEYDAMNLEREEYDQLIYNMIEQGKRYYFAHKMLPDFPLYIIFGYKSEQMEWCEKSEFGIWSYFVDHSLLYSVDAMDTKRYAHEGPTTPGMPSESPGMVGAWIGYKIVEKYIEKTKTTLPSLIGTSPKNIYSQSGYKPKK